ncbi:Serine-protein kinase RsbW [Roseobacter fucihabitans]|uniref:Serine-protein kinase RsbW n=1 Tax=Roseobacter fucihabitans TaxID=1537242 RepID=A0ABZ2BPL1_9RHOB|nr:ATP-binding protein [Roseobacter litoralis]MBC6963592.1 serine-protein kinase RsbW [Roseobacter litoralis]
MALLPAFEFSVQSSEMAVREALRKFLNALDPLNLDEEAAGTVELVLAEALNNIVEHAYPQQESCGPIALSCNHLADGLHVRIVDEGKEMPGGAEPSGNQASLDVDHGDLPEGGFGWFLIHDLAKDVKYQRIGVKNQLSIRLAVGLAPARKH